MTIQEAIDFINEKRLTYDRLLRLSEPKRILRSKTVKVPPIKVEATSDGTFFIFNAKSSPSTTGLRQKGYIKFYKTEKPVSLEKAECIVDCTCFSGDTLVLMGDGTYKAISDISPGDSVYTHKGRVRKVKWIVPRNLKPGEDIYSVSITGFPTPVIASGTHPFYVLRGNTMCRCGCGKPLTQNIHEWKSLRPKHFIERKYLHGHHKSPHRTSNIVIEAVIEDLKNGLTVKNIAKKYGISHTTVSYINIGRIKSWERLPDSADIFKPVAVQDFRKHEWSITPWLEEGKGGSLDGDFARLLGYYASEGHLVTRNVGGHVSFTIHADEQYTLGADITRIVEKLHASGDYGFRRSTKHGRGKLTYTSRFDDPSSKHPIQAISIFCYIDVKLRDYLLQHIGAGSWHKRVSPYLMGLDNETLRQFLIGLFLGDGYTRPKGSFRWSSASRVLVWNVSTILNRLRIPHVITGTRPHLSIDICKPEAAREIHEWLTPYLREKTKKRICKGHENLEFDDLGGHPRFITKKLLDNFEGQVWDMCVEEDHSFIVHGVAVSNCSDYRYRFAWSNKQRRSGVVGPKSLNQAWNKAPKITNPSNTPGMCKHLLAIRDYIYGQASRITSGPVTTKTLDKLIANAKARWADMPGAMAKARDREKAIQATRQGRRVGTVPEPVEKIKPEAPVNQSELEQYGTEPAQKTVPVAPGISKPMTPVVKPVTAPEQGTEQERKRRAKRKRNIHGESLVVMSMSTKTQLNEAIKLLEEIEAAEQPKEEGDQGTQVLSLLSQIRDLLSHMVGEEEEEEKKEQQVEEPEAEENEEELGAEAVGEAPKPEA